MKFPFVLLLSAFCLCSITAISQSLQKTGIGKTGVSFGSYCPMRFEQTKSMDSSTVYNSECSAGGITYGVILVKLVSPREKIEDAEQLTAAYLDYLNSSFSITHAEGYQKGLRLHKDESTRGISDNWGDAEKNIWKVIAWTNGRFIAVLYAYSKKEMAAARVNAFLESVQFPK